jgi:hypothetical protein
MPVMAKSNNRRKNDWYDDNEDFITDRKQKSRDQNRKRDNRLKNAMKSRDIDTLLQEDDY